MASNVEIANRALTKIGAARIISLDDNTKSGREVNSMFTIIRDAELREHAWRFSIKRIQQAAHATPPVFGYARQFRVPADCLKLWQVGDWYPGVDLTDYVGADTSPYAVENGFILTDYAAPLNLRYIARVEDPTLYDALFVEVFACRLALELAEPIAQSTSKKESALRDYNLAVSAAMQANAIENPPQKVADDTWVMARL